MISKCVLIASFKLVSNETGFCESKRSRATNSAGSRAAMLCRRDDQNFIGNSTTNEDTIK